ncbi:galactokinase [Kitasatospora sp. NPDC057015]|uniref:galactokinase n=1 Tax=Kitasatospora sp. NPDC057015 TaxID=3346001 RepID=UPI0036322D37
MTPNELTEAFTAVYGEAPDGVWAAPGRVNLIGEHTDYNDGFVLPIALPHAARAAVRLRADDRLRLHSAQGDGGVVELTADQVRPGAVPGWARYPAGVVWALRDAGHPVGGADIHFDSDVPTGAGLSSSAALECVVAVAYNDLWDLGLGRVELGLLAQRAENVFVGVPCGAMDQLASTCCEAGRAMFLDTRTLTARQLPVDLAAAGLRLLVVDTRVKHDLADGAYAERRSGCEKAAGLLGLPALRDLGPAGLPAALDALPDEGLRALTRHVVTENARVEAAVEAMLAGDPAALGPILTAGHASLRDDFRVSCDETDLVVETAVAAGALGARMTGGGFGGSVIALVAEADAEHVAAAVTAAFTAAGYATPRVFTALAAQGARRLA